MTTMTGRVAAGARITTAQMDANFKEDIVPHTSGTLNLGESHNRSVINSTITAAATINLPDAGTAVGWDTGDFRVTIINNGSADITLGRTDSADTVDGTAADLTLIPSEVITIVVLSTTAYQVVSRKLEGLQENGFINGSFDSWQYGTSSTSSGYVADDRWYNSHTGGTKTTSRQAVTLGDIPGEPKYFSRTVVTSSAGAPNNVLKQYRWADVRTYAGETVTVSFYAKEAASQDISIEFIQNFGSGGLADADVTAIGVSKKTLTTSWAMYTVTASIPNITGKVLDGDDDFLGMNVWFDAGSNFDARTDTLGHQSGTFDLTKCEIVRGGIPLPCRKVPVEETLRKCQEYCYIINDSSTDTYIAHGFARSGGGLDFYVQLPVVMRKIPAVTESAIADFQYIYRALSSTFNSPSFTVTAPSVNSVRLTSGTGSSLSTGEGAILYLGASSGGYLKFQSEVQP